MLLNAYHLNLMWFENRRIYVGEEKIPALFFRPLLLDFFNTNAKQISVNKKKRCRESFIFLSFDSLELD